MKSRWPAVRQPADLLAGFDVQQTLIDGTPEEVRAEVRYLIDTFDRPDGGMCLAAGNGILPGTPLENIEAFLDEAWCTGKRNADWKTIDNRPGDQT